jgi:hypothetical protein
MNNPPDLPPFVPDENLTRGQNSRIYVYNTIADLVVYGYNFEEILSLYSEAGVSIPPKELSTLQDWVNQGQNEVFDLSQVPHNMPIPEHVMDTFSSPHDTQYRYIGEFVTYDEETGERREWRFIYDSDWLLSRDIASGLMLEHWQEEYPLQASVYVSSINIVQAYRNP